MQRQVTGSIFAVSDTEDDCVALVSLHALQILYEEPLASGGVEKRVQVSLMFQCLIEGSLHSVHVPNPHRDYAERLIRVLASMFEHQFNNFLYLLRAALFLTVHAQFLLNDNMADRWRSTRPRGFDNHSKRTVQFN